MKSVVDFARGGVEEEGEEEEGRGGGRGREEEKERTHRDDDRSGNEEKISQTKNQKKKTMDFLGGGGGSYAKRAAKMRTTGSASLVTKAISEEDAMKFLELAEKCVLFAKEKEEYKRIWPTAFAKKAFAVVARSYVKTLREMGFWNELWSR